MSNHTPGPWEIGGYCNELGDGLAAINGEGWWELAGVVVEVGGQKNDEGIANARLIAAAPELLEALESFPGFTDDAGMGDAWLEKMRAAINKATGGE